MKARVGIVVIGRNEGVRLTAALDAALAEATQVVYVDSGSRDGSAARARAHGVPVIGLDATMPFTAARARNAGATYWASRAPEPEFLQFVDGDCELVRGFLEQALDLLDRQANVAIVCGGRREKFPRASIYNRWADIEWDAPAGETKSCGGDALVRANVFCAVGGYDRTLIAGEDPDFCWRVRRAGWKIWRIDAEMTRHDARLVHFSQWWQRSVRTGYAYALGAWRSTPCARRTAREAEHLSLRESMSIWFWGAALWSTALALAKPSKGASIALLLAYPALVMRIFLRARGRGLGADNAALYAFFCLLGKFPQLQGQILFLWNQTRKQPTGLIEY